jgi:very-short-patch-repair endonuclease
MEGRAGPEIAQRWVDFAENQSEPSLEPSEESMSPRYEQLKSRARQMRKNATFEERLLWSRLRKKQLGGVKFRRQHILKPYIVDYYAAGPKLVVEIDGERHRFPMHAAEDTRRDQYLREAYDVDVLRVTAAQVRQNIGAVLEKIEAQLTMNSIEYQTDLDGITAADLDGFFVGWPTHPNSLTHLRMLDNSYAIALAVDTDHDRVVGFANAISDGVLSAYIPLLEVLPNWQGRGIGTRLIEVLCEQLDGLYMIDLVCDAELEAFYEPLGFRALTRMARRYYENQTDAPAPEGDNARTHATH